MLKSKYVFVNVLPQRDWIQSVVNGTDPDPDLKIWSNTNPYNFAADENCIILKRRNENSSARQKICSTLLNTFLILCVLLI